MATTRSKLLLCAWLAVGTAFGAQTIYRSVGPDGKIVYGDRPPTEGRLDRKMKFADLPASPLPAPARSSVEQMKRSTPAATLATSAVVLYSASWCGYCKAAKAYLGSRRIAYQEVDVDTAAGQASYAQAGGGNGVPLLVAGGERIQGFSPQAYDAFFTGRR